MMPGFFDQATNAKPHQCLGVGDRNLVVEFLPGVAKLARLEIEESLIAGDANAHRRPLLARVHRRDVVDVALRHAHRLVDVASPAFTGNQVFPIDFYAQRVTSNYSLPANPRVAAEKLRPNIQSRSNNAIDSTCAVCG